jgi:small-conductance mechanosensitive channel
MAGGIAPVLLVLLCVVTGTVAAQQHAVPQQTPASAPGAVIPVAEVATQATAVSTLLRMLSVQVAPTPIIDTIRRVLPEASETIDLELAATSTMWQGQPTLELLQTQQQLWQRRQLQMTGWLHVLTERARHLQEMAQRLTARHTTWTATRAAAPQAPEPIHQQIDATLVAIAAAQMPLDAQRVAVLDLQSRVAQGVALCEQVLAQIAQVQQQVVTGMLVRDGLPFWRAALWTEARTALPARVRQVATTYWSDMLRYVRNPAEGLPWHVGLFLVLALMFGAARRQSQRWQEAGEAASAALSVFRHPVAAALLVTLLIATSPFTQVPLTVREVFYVVALLPMLLLTQPVVAASMVPGLYALSGLFALDIVTQALAGASRLGQVLLVGETLLGLLVAGWMLGHLRRAPDTTARPSEVSALRLGTWLFVLTFAAGLLTSSLGYGRLARLMTSSILAGGILALTLAAFVRVVSGVLAAALRVWPLQALHLVQRYRDLLEYRLSRVLVWLAVLGWLARYLNYLGLLEPVLASGYAVLTARLERGSISLSVEDVLAFGLTVVGAYLLSAFLRFVLDEDVYPRTRITAGQSYALSSLLHYIILALGFVVGLGLLGMDLTRLTVLVGALGVGIGFGMQSVVNNFISGIILLFERPLHVGDVVELGALQGVVRRIGIRASVVHTWQGADLIVPNSHLVTEQVTNWTLTDQLRRIDLPVGVNYGAVPQQVIALLETLAGRTRRCCRIHPPRPFSWAMATVRSTSCSLPGQTT